MEITELTPSHIRLQIGDRSVTVQGEAFLRGYGSPDFVVYSDSIRQWDAPNNGVPIDAETKKTIVELIEEELHKRNMTVEFE